MTNPTIPLTGLGLDVGGARIGVARARLDVRMASPLRTLEAPATFIEDIIGILRSEDAAWVVIGLPRGLEGQDTEQTGVAKKFGQKLTEAIEEAELPVPVYWIDEALTSQKAEQELQSRGKSYTRPDVDALAATYILEDFLKEQAPRL